MVRASAVLEVVKKTTGGKAWLPPWGFTGLTRTQRANRKKNLQQDHQVLAALREGEASERKAAAAAKQDASAPQQ